MNAIEQLIETVYDETGIQGVALRVSRNDDGWTACVVEGDDILLCCLGERFLVSNGNETMEQAVAAVEAIAAQSQKSYMEEQRYLGTPV